MEYALIKVVFEGSETFNRRVNSGIGYISSQSLWAYLKRRTSTNLKESIRAAKN